MRARTLIVIGLLSAMTACAASPAWDPLESLDTFWKPRGGASNGVQLMARDECEALAAFNSPCPLDEPIDVRATNSALETRCYRWRVLGPEAVAAHKLIDSGWQTLPPSKAASYGSSSDRYVGRLEWGLFHIGQRCFESKLIALRVPPQGACQDYNDAITVQAVMGDWAFDWKRLLEIAGVDASGGSRLQELFGDIRSVPGPDGVAVPIEVAAGLVSPAPLTPSDATAGSVAVAELAGSVPAQGLPANYLTLGADERLLIVSGLGIVSEVRVLLDAGANVNARDAAGMTALMRAAQGGHRPVVEALLAYGADPKLTTPDGRTAASVATAAGHGDIARLLGNIPSAPRP